AMLDPVWEEDRFDASRWSAFESQNAAVLQRIPALRAEYVVGTRPATSLGRRLNEGFLWSAAAGFQPLRKKYFLPPAPWPPPAPQRRLAQARRRLVPAPAQEVLPPPGAGDLGGDVVRPG